MKMPVRIAIVLLSLAAIIGVIVFATVTRTTFENTNDPGRPTLMDLGAEWCPPCRQLQPGLKRLRDKYEGEINIQYHDVDTEEGKAFHTRYKATALPTLVYLDAEGKEVKRHVGFRSETQLELDFRELGWTL